MTYPEKYILKVKGEEVYYSGQPGPDKYLTPDKGKAHSSTLLMASYKANLFAISPLYNTKFEVIRCG